MNLVRICTWVQLAFCGLLIAGALIWWFVRAPQGTSAGAIYRDVEIVGRLGEVTVETVGAVRRLATVRPNTPPEELALRRAHVTYMANAARRLSDQVQTAEARWVPVAEAIDLLQQCQDMSQLALDQITAPTAVDPVAQPRAGQQANPAFEQMAHEVATIVDERAKHILEQSDQLASRTERAIVGGLFARGTILGIATADFLLALLVLSTILGMTILLSVKRRLKIPLVVQERTEIEMMAKADRVAALKRCHNRVSELLEMADNFCRSGKT